MVSFTSILLVAAGAVASVYAEDFVGEGILNVVNQSNELVGCLTDTMAFTADTSKCATFTGTKTVTSQPPWGFTSTTRTFSTEAGPCGAPFKTGSQYQQGGNRVLVCGQGSDADNSYWGIATGVNDLIGQTLLKADNDSMSIFVTVDGKAPTGDEEKVLEQNLDGETPTYSLTWTAV